MTTKIRNGSIEIGRRIQAARKARNLSQAALAEKAGLSASQVSQIEQGKNDPKTLTLIRILEALQVPADQILRANIPSVNELGRSEYGELLSDCTPQEIETLIAFTKQLKETLRKSTTTE